MFFVGHSDHLLPLDLEGFTCRGCGRLGPKPYSSGNRLLANKLASREQRDHCFFAVSRTDCEF